MVFLNDESYIEKIKNGDSAAFSFLINKYKGLVFSITSNVLKNPQDAQDAAQESFLKVYQQLHKFEGRSKFSTWLYTITYRTAINKLKEERIQVIPLSEEIIESDLLDPAIDPAEKLQAKQIQFYVDKAIQKLPVIDGLLITLFYSKDLSIKEIQEITGLSTPNIKIKLYRARKTLERELKFLLQ